MTTAPTFGFGFNDSAFSDRVLHIVVIPDSLHSVGDCSSNAVEAKTLYVNSLVLAANSPFFYKLFKNEMRESQQRDMTLKVKSSGDVAALKDVVKFIYCNTMSATTTADLLDVLLAADKYEVSSCLNYCSLLLQKMPMSLDSALLFLELPKSVSDGKVVQPLVVSAKKYLAACYSNFNNSFSAVMVSKWIQKDYVSDFILKWASANYPIMEERREIIVKLLVQYIWFHYMSSSKLEEVQARPELGDEEASNLVFEAFLSKAKVHYLQHIHASKELATTNWSYLGRFYKYRPVKVDQLCFSRPRCVVYFDLKKEEFDNLFQSREEIFSQTFYMGGREFFLKAVCTIKKSFGLFLMCEIKPSDRYTLDYEVAVMEKSSVEFMGKDDIFTVKNRGYRNLFEMAWIDFMGKDDNEYFIDGILHLRADLTLLSNNVEG